MVSNHTLMKVASIGGFVTAGTGYVFHYRVQNAIRASDSFKDAMNTLQTHKKAVPYLGEPIALGRIRYGKGQRMLERKTCYRWFKVPLTGANTAGKLYYEVTLSDEFKNKSEVSKIEITFDNIPGKTFVMRDCTIN